MSQGTRAQAGALSNGSSMTAASLEDSGQPVANPRLRMALWFVGVFLALLQASGNHNFMNADGISYLDMSDGVVTGEWTRLINGTWSPLYPALLGVAARVLKPSAYWQFTLVHAVNVMCFVFAFACFEFLLRSIIGSRDRPGQDGYSQMPAWVCLTLGYTVFLWASLRLLTLTKPTPDMLMSGFLYLSMGLVMRIKRGQDGFWTHAALGLVLGLGYLAKTAMLPLGILMLAMTLFFGGGLRKTVPRVLVAFCVMLLIGGPYIVALSRLKHRPTFGDSATVTHLEDFDKAGPSIYWQNPGGAAGKFLHPPRKIFDNPPAYEFARSLAVTQPLWYDPSYWVEGVQPRFHLRSQLAAVRRNLDVYAQLFSRTGGLVVGFLILCFMVGAKRSLSALASFWPLWALATAALGMYMAIHVEERYIGAFLALLCLGLFCGFRIPDERPGKLLAGMVVGIVLTLAVPVFPVANQTNPDINPEQWRATGNRSFEIASALQQLRIRPHDHVARISPFAVDGWARLAKVTIVAEVQMTAADDFWCATPEVQDALLRAFAAAGAKAVVAPVRRAPLPKGWTKLGDTGFAAHLLS